MTHSDTVHGSARDWEIRIGTGGNIYSYNVPNMVRNFAETKYEINYALFTHGFLPF